MQHGLGAHFFQRLDSALYLLCLARLGPKSINKLLDVGHLSLLFCRHGLLALKLFRSQTLKGGVVALIEVRLFAG